jgi:hypothetical protein
MIDGSGWMSGAAARTFPVASGTPMAGYMARTGPATGTHDDLTVSALILEYDKHRLAIVSADIAAVDFELVNEVAAAAGIARRELALCASHTHSGPAGVIARMHPADEDRGVPELRQAFVSTCASAIQEAVGRLEPVALLFGQTETRGLAANRNDPSGPFDPRLSVLATRNRSDKLNALLVHFACHPTILGAANRQISADFPGALRRSLREAIGEENAPVISYVNGAAGDVSTRFTRKGQDFDEVDRVGAALAHAAVTALADACPIDGSISYEQVPVSLPRRSLALPTPPEPTQTDWVDRSPAERRRIETHAQGEALLAKLIEAGPENIRSNFDLEAWALGDLVLLAVPGELFASLGKQVTGNSTSPSLVFGYTNGYVGYLVDEMSHKTGTYEALASPFAPDAGTHLALAGIELVRRI